MALKVLWPETAENEENVQRFVRAMKTMMPIRHPNIVQIYAAGKTGRHCWLAMEYVKGEDLSQAIRRSARLACSTGAMPSAWPCMSPGLCKRPPGMTSSTAKSCPPTSSCALASSA